LFSFGWHPRQSITAADGSRPARAEWAVAVADDELRHGPKEIPAGSGRPKDAGDNEWEQPRPHERGAATGLRRDLPRPIGGGDEPSREADALGLIALEQRRGRAAAHDSGELPGEVHGVPDSGVHSLRADGTVHVRRVPEKKRSTHTEAGRHSVVDAVGREPVDPLDLETQLLD